MGRLQRVWKKLLILRQRDKSLSIQAKRAILALWFTMRARLGLDTVSRLADIEARIILPPRERGIARLIFTYGTEIEPELRTLDRFIRPGMTVCDIGANFGIYTLYMAHLTGMDGRVLSFEPVPETLSYLQRTIALNKLQNVVLLSSSALGDKPGMGQVSRARHDPGSNAIIPGHRADCCEIQITTLDDYCQSKAIKQIGFMKMDIEGGEHAALVGARGVVQRDRPVIMFEVNPVAASVHRLKGHEAFEFLSSLGYRLHVLKEDNSTWFKLTDFPGVLANVLATPSDLDRH